MSDPNAPVPEAKDHWAWQFWVTIGLLLAFALLLVVLMVNARDATDTEWNRRVYLLTAVQAIVFTSVGWLFGREVNREAVKTAKDTATSAAQEAATARKETAAIAQDAERERTKGEAMKVFVRNATPRPAAGTAQPGGAEETAIGGGRPSSPGLDVDLRAIAEELWPD